MDGKTFDKGRETEGKTYFLPFQIYIQINDEIKKG